MQADEEHIQANLPLIAAELAAAGCAVPSSAPTAPPAPPAPPTGEARRLELLEALREVATTFSTAAGLVDTAAVDLVAACAKDFPCEAVRTLADTALRDWRRTALVHIHTLTGARFGGVASLRAGLNAVSLM